MKPNDKADDGGNERTSNDRPVWITTDLVTETLRVWSRFSTSLSEQDAVSLILQFGQLLDATGLMRKQETTRESAHRTASGQQS
ncbi:MAG: hypothetical protein SH850_21755 [Planctomycetaceae bacterium]|nr:hypothetical protein [Planctomycetaceae bacterium]